MMRLNIKSSLLGSMIVLGLLYGFMFHYIVMPWFGSSLLHCIIMGAIFGFINFFTANRIYIKYNTLKKSADSLQIDIKTDKLTGLLNRRAFDNDIQEISTDEPYSMIFIDIDNFRKFNNEFGHPVGDTVLKKVSQTIKATVRMEDKVYRYGGEEIVILLKQCPMKKATEIAEKLRYNISVLDNSPYPHITISLGISSFPDNGRDVNTIIETCDKALLLAKRSGKNRVSKYSMN